MARPRLAALKVAPAALRQALLAVGRASYGGRDTHRTAAGTAALHCHRRLLRTFSFALAGLGNLRCSPTACAVGCILAPLCGSTIASIDCSERFFCNWLCRPLAQQPDMATLVHSSGFKTGEHGFIYFESVAGQNLLPLGYGLEFEWHVHFGYALRDCVAEKVDQNQYLVLYGEWHAYKRFEQWLRSPWSV